MSRGRSVQVESQRSAKKTPKTTPKHNIVVVRAAVQVNPDMDEDLFRLKVNYLMSYSQILYMTSLKCIITKYI